MKKSIISLTVILMVGLMTAFAWGHGDHKYGGCNGQQDRGAYKHLTDDQKSQLWELHQQWVDESYETRAAIMTKNQKLRMLMETSNPAKTDIQDLSDEIFELKKELADKRIDFALKAKTIAPEINFMGIGHRRGMGHRYMDKKMGHHPGYKKHCPNYSSDHHKDKE